MRKRYTVIRVNDAPGNERWWAEFKARPAEEIPQQLRKIQSGKAKETERLDGDDGFAALQWAASIPGWGDASHPTDQNINSERRPLAAESVSDATGVTESGRFVVYHVGQSVDPDAHRTSRGEYFFEPKDYGTERVYSGSYRTPDEALAAAEAHEREELMRARDASRALRASPRAPSPTRGPRAAARLARRRRATNHGPH